MEYFLRQRLSELIAKDQAAYSMYSESKPRHEMVKRCDNVEFVKACIYIIDQVIHSLNSKETLQLLLIRQKPKVSA